MAMDKFWREYSAKLDTMLQQQTTILEQQQTVTADLAALKAAQANARPTVTKKQLTDIEGVGPALADKILVVINGD